MWIYFIHSCEKDKQNYHKGFWNLLNGKLKWKSFNFSLPNFEIPKILIIHARFLDCLKARILSLIYNYNLSIFAINLLFTKRIFKHLPLAKQQKHKSQRIKIMVKKYHP
jgi:hypothetical protein